jgi:pilus assembly protein CpaB
VITLLVSPDDAQKLTLATSQGKIQLALRNPLDTKQQELNSVATGALYKGVSAPTPIAAARPKSTGAHAAKTLAPLPLPVYTVEVIKGTKREEVTPK